MQDTITIMEDDACQIVNVYYWAESSSTGQFTERSIDSGENNFLPSTHH